MKKKQAQTGPKYERALFTGFLLILAYLFLNFLSLNAYKESVNIEFKKESFKNRNENFYIYEDPSSLKFDFTQALQTGEPKILNTPITLVWKPEKFPLNKRVEIGATVQSDFDLEFQVNCKPCDRDIQNESRVFLDHDLYSYPYTAEFDDGFLYAKTPISNVSGSLTEWMGNNLPKLHDVEVLNDSLKLDSIKSNDVGYEKNSYSSIQTDLIGPHEFYLYLDNTLELQLKFRNKDYTKIDPTKIMIALYDLKDNKIFMETTSLTSIQSVPTDSLTQTFSARNIPAKGTYRLEVIIPEDLIIKAVDVNTNKIVVNNHANLSREASLYTRVENQREFFALPKNYNGITDIQVVKQLDNRTEETRIVDLNRNNLVIDREISLEPGDYRIESGGAVEFNGLLFSFSSEQFFNPFIYELSSRFTSDYVVSNSLQKIDAGVSEIKYILNSRDLSLLKSLGRIEFTINSIQLANRFNTENFAKDRYFLSTVLTPYTVYAQKDEKDIYGTSDSDIAPIGTLNNLLPVGSTLLFTTKTIFPQELFIADTTEESVKTEVNHLDLHLLGDHQFYIATGENLNLQVEIDPYLSDQLFQIQLRNSDGKVICSKNYAGNSSDRLYMKFECDTKQNSIYILSVRSQRQELANMKGAFEIVNMEINTDKVMIKERARTLSETKYFSSSKVEQRVEITPLSNSSNILVTVSQNNTFNISGSAEDDAQEMVIKTMPKGNKVFEIDQKGLIIKGTNFTLKQENLFDPYSHYLVIDINSNPQYIVSDVADSNGFYIKDITLDVK